MSSLPLGLFVCVWSIAWGLSAEDGGVSDMDGTLEVGESRMVSDAWCDGGILRFRDDSAGREREIDCETLSGRCGELNSEWGLDCVLSQGADCDVGYAYGYTRCDREAGLFCVDGQCIVSEPMDPEEILPPANAAGIGDRADDSGSCQHTSPQHISLSFMLIGFAILMRRHLSQQYSHS